MAKLQTDKAGKKVFQSGVLKYRYYYLLLLPGILYFIIFKYLPIFGNVIAFKDYTFAEGIWNSPWVGLKWFKMLFSNGDFSMIIGNTIIISLLKIIFGFPAPIILALLLNELKNKTYKKLIQTVVYLPHFLSWVVIAGVMFVLFSSTGGIIKAFGISQSPLMNEQGFRWILILSDVWKEAGWGTVVYLAAITGIDPALYEAAWVDGANRFQRVLYITLPALTGTIAILLIMKTGSIMTAGFDQIYVLQNPSVYRISEVIDTYVFRVGLSQGRFALASAAGLFQGVVGLITVLFVNKIVKKISGESVL